MHPEGFFRHFSRDASMFSSILSTDTSTMAHLSGVSFLQYRTKYNSLVGTVGVSIWSSANICNFNQWEHIYLLFSWFDDLEEFIRQVVWKFNMLNIFLYREQNSGNNIEFRFLGMNSMHMFMVTYIELTSCIVPSLFSLSSAYITSRVAAFDIMQGNSSFHWFWEYVDIFTVKTGKCLATLSWFTESNINSWNQIIFSFCLSSLFFFSKKIIIQ